YGHPQSFTESFAAYRPEPDITLARYILNEQLVRGINVMETMFYSATRPAPPAPPAPRPARPSRCTAPSRRPFQRHARPRLPRARRLRPPHRLRYEHGPPGRFGRALHPVKLHV